MQIIKDLIWKVKTKMIDDLTHFRIHYETKIDNKLSQKAICKSFVGNWLQWEYAQYNRGASGWTSSQAPWSSAVNIFSLGGTPVNGSTIDRRLDAAANTDTYGIILSTDTTTPSATDYQIAGKISNGTAGGQIQYGAMSGNGVVVTGNQSKITIQRTFINNSGASITVNKFYVVADSYLIIEEKLPVADTILNTQSYSVTIYVTITT